MVKNRLQHFLSINPLNEDQSGFTPGRSTLNNLARLEQEIKTGQLYKHYTIAIFLDFSKAFDMVWHNGLVQKLLNKGLSGNIINYIQDFLQNRQITVGVENQKSDFYPLENGTPQGSIISPTLFNIMVDDLFEGVSPKISTSKFADDGALWVRIPNIHTSRKLLQSALNEVDQWADNGASN